jgi:hypothetical protein
VSKTSLSNVTLADYGIATWPGRGNIVLDKGAHWDNESGSTFTVSTGLIPMVKPGQNATGAEVFTVDAGATLTDNYGIYFQTSLIVGGTYNIGQTYTALMSGGGTITGTVNVPTGAELYLGTGSVTLEGANITGSGRVTLGRLINGGQLNVTGNSTISNFVQSGGTLSGTAALTLTGSNNQWTGGTWNGTGQVIVAPNSSLTLDKNPLTITGGWSLTNNGIITQTAAAPLTVDGGTSITNNANTTFNTASNVLYSGNGGPAGSFTNSGTFLMTGNGTSKVGLGFTNSGTLQINSGTLEFIQDLKQTAGVTFLNGGNLRDDGGVGFTITGGTLYGGGTITAAKVDNYGTIDQTQVANYVTLNIAGAYTQEASGTLNLKIRRMNGVLQSDQLAITLQANLGGTLNVMGNVTPQVGDSDTILTYGSVVNDFKQPINVPPGFKAQRGMQSYVVVPS